MEKTQAPQTEAPSTGPPLASSIAMTWNTPTQRKSQSRRGEYSKKLLNENALLRQQIIDIQAQITAVEAQNKVLMQQLEFFKNQLPECYTSEMK